MTESLGARRLRLSPRLTAAIVVTLIALVIRCARIRIEGMNGDEIFQIRNSLLDNIKGGFRGWLGAVLGGSIVQSQPFFSYAAIRLSSWMLGPSLWSYRLPSILAGTGLTVATLSYTRSWFQGWKSAICGLIPTFYFWNVVESNQARPYSWVMLFAFLGLWFRSNWFSESEPTLKRKLAYPLIVFLGTLTNLFCGIGFCCLGLLDLIYLAFEKDPAVRSLARARWVQFLVGFLPTTPYLAKLVVDQAKYNLRVPEKDVWGVFQKLKIAIPTALKYLPQVFENTQNGTLDFDPINYLFAALLLLLYGLVKNRKKINDSFIAVFLMTIVFSFLFSYMKITWWGNNYIAFIRTAQFWLQLQILKALWDQGGWTQKLAQSLLAYAIAINAYGLAQKWPKSVHEDWIAAVHYTQNLPKDIEIHFDPDWVGDMIFPFIAQMEKLELTLPVPKKEPVPHSRLCLATNSHFKKPSDAATVIPNTEGWVKTLDAATAYLYCGQWKAK